MQAAHAALNRNLAANVAAGSFSTDRRCLRNVRFPSDRYRIAALRQRTKGANFRLARRSKPCQFQVPDNAHSVRSVRLAYRLSASTRADAPLAQMRPDLAADKIQLSRRKRLGDLAGAVNEKLGQAGSAFDRNPMHGDFQRKNA